jgi:hypothetical protein
MLSPSSIIFAMVCYQSFADEICVGDGRDSNSPSPNQRPLPLGSIGIEDNSDLEAGSAFGGGSTLAGAGTSVSSRTPLLFHR